MMKQASLPLLVTLMTTLAGCSLYFGEDHGHGGGTWTYCGQDGYYECDGNDCYWQGPTCPPNSQPPPGGFECKTSADCAAGCYCGPNGTCEEAGFCTQDSDCGTGYTCNEQRSSCEPTGTPQPVSCGADNDCPTGQYCDSATLLCTATCTCTTDAEAKAQGFDYCDEGRTTCLPGADPAGDCVGTVTCNQIPTSCPEGQVPLIVDGCYTGWCSAINACATAPTCASYQHDADCLADTTCSASYTGINCRAPDNTSCQAGSTNCVCDSYQFASCATKSGSMPRMVVEYNGMKFDASALTLRN